jgi:sec-independent protein translocase protein TatB
MFGLSFVEIAIVAVLALLLLGPDQLPAAAKALGKGLRELRKATDELKGTFEREMVKLERDVEEAQEPKQPPVAPASRSGTAGALGMAAWPGSASDSASVSDSASASVSVSVSDSASVSASDPADPCYPNAGALSSSIPPDPAAARAAARFAAYAQRPVSAPPTAGASAGAGAGDGARPSAGPVPVARDKRPGTA